MNKIMKNELENIDIGNETLTINEVVEIFKYLIDNMQSEKTGYSASDFVWVLSKYNFTKPLYLTDKAENKILSLDDIVRVCYHIFSKNGDNAGILIDENKIDYNYKCGGAE